MIDGFDVWEAVKWGYLLMLVMYLLFSAVVWRQIQLMSRTLNGSMELPLRLVGMGLVIVSAGSLVIGWVIL